MLPKLAIAGLAATAVIAATALMPTAASELRLRAGEYLPPEAARQWPMGLSVSLDFAEGL